MAADEAARPAARVRVQLRTRDRRHEVAGGIGVLLVSTAFRRYTLSTLVNKLLGNAAATPFEFTVDGQALRGTLDDFLTENGLSTETIVELEYASAVVPPTHRASLPHDDWVSSVDVLSAPLRSGHERVLSGSYDGTVRVWSASAAVVASSAAADVSAAPTRPIKDVKFLDRRTIVSAGLDRTVRLWRYDGDKDKHEDDNDDGGDGDKDTGQGVLVPVLDLYGHTAGVEGLAVSPASRRILSASHDHTVAIWAADGPDGHDGHDGLPPAGRPKRRRLERAQAGPTRVLTGHAGPVSAVIFRPTDATIAHSASWDRSLRTWDLPTASLVDVRTTAAGAGAGALLALAALPALSLVAAAGAGRTVGLIDIRSAATTVAPITLRGHTNAVSALARDPANDYCLASGSHDGTCRVWDLRRPAGDSVFVFGRQAAAPSPEPHKVFDLKWDSAVGILSCGDDGVVQINKGSDLGTGALPS